MASPLTLFYSNGKNFIGGLVTLDTNGITINGPGKITSSSDYYVVKSPCEIDFELVEVPGSTSRIEYKKIMPLCPIRFSSKNGDDIYFAFEKKSTFISNVTDGSLNEDIKNAYKKLTGVTSTT